MTVPLPISDEEYQRRQIEKHGEWIPADVCPKCRGEKAPYHEVCTDCWKRENGFICPTCGGNKKADFDECYKCGRERVQSTPWSPMTSNVIRWYGSAPRRKWNERNA